MAMTLQPLRDHRRLDPLLARAPWPHVRQRSLLHHRRYRSLQVLVDDPESPGVSLVNDGRLWDLAAVDVERGSAALDAFPFDGTPVSFAGLDEPFSQLLRTQREVRWLSSAYLYGLLEPADLRLPETTNSLSCLTEDDLGQVDDAWPHGRGVASRLEYLRWLIVEGPTVALRLEGRLVSFALAHADGALGILHTEPPFRRRGFGRQVLAGLIRAVLERGWSVFGHVMRGNQASEALVQAVGLRPIRPADWLGVR